MKKYVHIMKINQFESVFPAIRIKVSLLSCEQSRLKVLITTERITYYFQFPKKVLSLTIKASQSRKEII